jgi:thiol-disulfide isomerase/thioredoxin
MGLLRRGYGVGVACAALLLLAVPQGRAIVHHAMRAVGLERPVRQLHTGDELGSLKLFTLDGAPVTLVNTGRPQIINVFATWCTECKAETPDLARVADTLRSSGVQLIGIDQSENATTVTQFAEANGLHYPIYVDGDGSVTHSILGARYIPTTIVIDRHGVIRFEHIGPLTRDDFSSLARAVRNAG